MKVLKNKTFRIIVTLHFLSKFSDALFYLALLTYANGMAEASWYIMIVSFSERFPSFLKFFSGKWADDYQQKQGPMLRLSLLRLICYLLIATIVQSKPTLVIISACGLINIMSDFFGNTMVSLLSPYPSLLFEERDWASSAGVSSMFQTMGSILPQLITPVFIMFLSFSKIALINSAVFLLISVILWSKQSYFVNLDKQLMSFEQKTKLSMKEAVKISINEIKKNLLLLKLLCLNTLTTLLVGSLESIFALILVTLRVSDAKFSLLLSVFFAAGTFGNLTGFSLGTYLFSNKNVFVVNHLLFCSLGLFVMTFLTTSYFLIYVSVFTVSFFMGVYTPKWSALFRKKVPTRYLATVSGFFDTASSSVYLIGNICLNVLVMTKLPIMIAVFLGLSVLLMVINHSIKKHSTIGGLTNKK